VQNWNPSRGKRFFSSLKCPDWLWYPPCHIFTGYRGSFLGVRLLGHEVDRSPLSGIKVRNKWSCASSPFIWPHDLVRENLSFLTLPPASRLLVGKTISERYYPHFILPHLSCIL